MVSDGIAGFGIGSGVPKLHPMSVQSGAALLTGGAVEVGPMLQSAPVQPPSQAPPPAAQLSANRLVEPSGIGASGRMAPLPPMFRPPQVRVRMRMSLPSNMLPQVPPRVQVGSSRED